MKFLVSCKTSLKWAAFVCNGNEMLLSFPKWPVNGLQTVPALDTLGNHKGSRSHSEMFCELGGFNSQDATQEKRRKEIFFSPLPGTCEVDKCPYL